MYCIMYKNAINCVECLIFYKQLISHVFTPDTDVKINQIARDVGINIQDLDEPCSQHHLLPISQHLEHWSSYGERLGLTRVEIESIETDIRLTAPHAKGLEMLKTWQKICGGMTVKAFYRHLLRGCIEINRDLGVVRYICNLINSA